MTEKKNDEHDCTLVLSVDKCTMLMPGGGTDNESVLVFGGGDAVLSTRWDRGNTHVLQGSCANQTEYVHLWVYSTRKNEDGAEVRYRIATGWFKPSAYTLKRAHTIHCFGLDNDKVCTVKITVDRTQSIWPELSSSSSSAKSLTCLNKHIDGAEAFWTTDSNSRFGRLQWTLACCSFPDPIGDVPYFAFFYHASWVHQDAEPFLDHLIGVAQMRGLLPLDPDKWTDKQCLAAAVDIATAVPLGLEYSVDKDGNGHAFDQWARILPCVGLDDLTYDCEDGTEHAVAVLFTLKNIDAKQNKRLRRIQRTLQRYSPVVCLCVVPLNADRRGFHCVPLLLPSRALGRWKKGGKGGDHNPDGLVVETTNRCQPARSVSRPSFTEYGKRAIRDPLARMMIPWSTATHRRLYQEVVSVIDPESIRDGMHCQWAPRVSSQSDDPPTVFELLADNKQIVFVPVLKTPLSKNEIAELDRVFKDMAPLSTLPRPPHTLYTDAEIAEFVAASPTHSDSQVCETYYCRPADWGNSLKQLVRNGDSCKVRQIRLACDLNTTRIDIVHSKHK